MTTPEKREDVEGLETVARDLAAWVDGLSSSDELPGDLNPLWLKANLPRLLEELRQAQEGAANWKRLAEHHFGHMRAALDLSYALQYLFDPAVLERAADAVDCGGSCETAWREHDTNATGCTKSESEEGCPFELAADLREIAKAIRIQAWTLAFSPAAEARALKLEEQRKALMEAVKSFSIYRVEEDIGALHVSANGHKAWVSIGSPMAAVLLQIDANQRAALQLSEDADQPLLKTEEGELEAPARDPEALRSGAMAAVEAWLDWCHWDETMWDAYGESTEGVGWSERRRKAAQQALTLLTDFGTSRAPAPPSKDEGEGA